MKHYDRAELPPGGFHVTIPETGMEISSNHPSDFISKVRAHMEVNGIPITGGWKERLWDTACTQHPEWRCGDDGRPQERRFTSDDVWRFLTTLWKAHVSGATRVTPEEQDRRLAICKSCPKLTRITCGLGCGKMAEALSTLALGPPANSQPSRLQTEMHKQNCGICGCELTTVSSYPLEVLRAVDEELKPEEPYPEGCWKNTQLSGGTPAPTEGSIS